MLLKKLKYLSVLAVFGITSCTTNQYVLHSGGQDDLYGGSAREAVAARSQDSDQDFSRSSNPEYQQSYENTQGTADYYDESYLSTSSVKRNVSDQVGYNAGFVDGYSQATRFSSPYAYNGFGYGGLGSYYPGGGINMMLGFGNGFGMSPYIGMGSMMGYGYSPWGYRSMMYDPWGYNSYGYNSPWGYGYGNSFGGYGLYDSYYYGRGYYGGAVVVVNNYDRAGLTRSYGPRVASNGASRRVDRYNSNFVNTPRTNTETVRSGRRSAESYAGGEYASPRSNRSGGTSGRVSAESSYGSRSANRAYTTAPAGGSNTYYSRPRSNAGSYTPSEGTTAGNYSTSRSARSTYSAPASGYEAPARSQSNYNRAPARSQSSYSSPSRSSESYSAPARSSQSNAPSYSAPARSSYSAPASSSGSSSGGGGARSSSRGPR
jgi:hypothetical protein